MTELTTQEKMQNTPTEDNPTSIQPNTMLEIDSDVASGFVSTNNKETYDDNQIQLNLTMDGGASNTRTLPIGSDGKIDLKEISSLESRYALVSVNEQFDMHKITDNSIEENGEFIITELGSSAHIGNSWFATPVKVLKGALIERANKSPIYIDNQVDKTKDMGLFINTLTAIAVVGLQKNASNLNVRLSLSVPPKERYMKTERLNEFKAKLAGTYEVVLPRFNYTATINIAPKDINIEAEGELAYIFHVSVGKGASERLKELQDEIAVVHDLGKSTFNLSAVRNKKLIGPSHTVKTGGDNLVSHTYLLLSRELDNPITLAQAQQAVETGFVKDGVGTIPVGQYLTQAKEEIAEMLYNEYVKYLQMLTISFNQVHTILFVGRGMGTTGYIDEDGEPSPTYSPSIADILTAMYKVRSPHTKYVLVANAGLANLLGNASLMRSQWFTR